MEEDIYVICEYCDSRVVLDDDISVCPACGAPLGAAIEAALEAEEERRQKEQEEAEKKAEEERKARERQHFIDAAVNVVTGIVGAASSASHQHQYHPHPHPQPQPRPQHQHQSQPRPQHGEIPSGSGKQVHPLGTGYPGRKQNMPSGRPEGPGKGKCGHGPREKD